MAVNRLLALLIAVATVAFAVGVSIESSDTHTEPAEAAHAESEEGEAAEAGHVGAESEESGAHGESEDEKVLGIDLESTPLVVLAVIASLALAMAVWLRPDVRGLLALTALAMLVFAALDVPEVFHEIDESESGLAVLAGVVAALHLGAAALALRFQAPTERARPA
jgi:hypothetical protein